MNSDHLTQASDTVGRGSPITQPGLAELVAALKEVGEWFGLTKPPLDQWEDLAEEFHKETGFLRPGKDYPMGYGLDEAREVERVAAWTAWAEKRRSAMVARVRTLLAKHGA
jgi:hypothetical protein